MSFRGTNCNTPAQRLDSLSASDESERERHGHICRVGVESEASDVDATFRRSKLEAIVEERSLPVGDFHSGGQAVLRRIANHGSAMDNQLSLCMDLSTSMRQRRHALRTDSLRCG